jgi:hypothetical protein
VSRERDQLAEQYRSYSRDLAGQAERLSKQLRRYQENAKMVHREAGLVQHVAELESKLQTFIRGGRSVTEKEVCRLKDQLLGAETDLRLARDERTKLQEMFAERSEQVEDTMKRLAVSDSRVLELRARAAGLESLESRPRWRCCRPPPSHPAWTRQSCWPPAGLTRWPPPARSSRTVG